MTSNTSVLKKLIEQLSSRFDSSIIILGEDVSSKYHADWSGATPLE